MPVAVQYCTNHKDRETLRICGRCERPFCPDCLISTPVGGRCRECARPAKHARMVVEPWRWPLVALVAFLGGVVGGAVFHAASWFFIIIALAAGQIMAGAILPVAGRRPGRALAVVSAVFIVIGVLAAMPLQLVLSVLAQSAPGPVSEALGPGVFSSLLNIYTWVGAALMAGTAFTRLR